MKKDRGILKTHRQDKADCPAKKTFVQIRDSEETNCSRGQRAFLLPVASTPSFKNCQEREDNERDFRKSTCFGQRRPRLKCMAPAKSLPPLTFEGRMLNSARRIPGFSSKKSIKFDMSSVKVISYISQKDNKKLGRQKTIIPQNEMQVEENCCVIY